MMQGKGESSKHGPIRLCIWRIVHFWHYWPEIRWFFWGIRLWLSLWLDRARGRTPLLFQFPVWGHRQFSRPIMEELRKRSRTYSFYLILDQKDGLPKGNLLGVARWRVRPAREYRPFAKWFAAMLIADNKQGCPVCGCPIRIYTGHGLPSKILKWDTGWLSLLFTHVFLQGPLFRELQADLALRAPEEVEQLEWLEEGYPKSDGLLARKGKKERDALLERFGLDPKRPTVLYAPAFNRKTSLELYGEDIFRTLAGLEGINVLVKLHPVSYDRSVIGVHSQGIYWPDVLKKYEGDRFRHLGNVDVTECLLAADALVGDVSGVSLEYLLLDRPVIYLACPDFFRSVGAPPDGGPSLQVNVGRPAGVEVGDMEGLAKAIREALANPERHSAERQAIARRLVYNPGHAAEAAADALERILAEHRNEKVSRHNGFFLDRIGVKT